MTLESRVLATGSSGQLAVDILLGKLELKPFQVSKHECLCVCHLGPHLAGKGASAEQHIAAISAQLQKKPQVLIVDEAQESEDACWTVVFKELVTADSGLKQFHGALVINVSEKFPFVINLCTQQWGGELGWLWQEPLIDDLTILENVPLDDHSEKTPSELNGFLDKATELSKQVFFEEDSIEKSRNKGWTVTLLTEACREDPTKREFCGFMCHALHRPPKAEFHIARIAVLEHRRGKGYGRRLMRWALEKCAGMPQSRCAWISLSALDEAIPFYEQFGFTDMTCDNLDDDEHFQTWMELKNNSIVKEEVEAETTDQSDDEPFSEGTSGESS